MTAEQYLEQVKQYDVIIVNKMRDYKHWKNIADSLGGFSVGERVQSTKNLHKGADAIDTYLDIDNEIKELKEKRQAIIDTLQMLPYDEYDVLYKLYVEYDYNLKVIMVEKGMSYAWVKWKKQRGLEHLQEILDKNLAFVSPS